MSAHGLSEVQVSTLRRLAERRLAMAEDPANAERRQAWLELDAGAAHRPMVLVEFEGVRDARGAVAGFPRVCLGTWAEGVEWALLAEAYRFDVLRDDHVVEPFIDLQHKVSVGDFGVQAVQHHGIGDGGAMGARSWEPPLKDLDRDFHLLKPRRPKIDRAATQEDIERAEAVFKGLIPLRMRGAHWWSFGMTGDAIVLIGLEGLMLAMYDHPEGLHRLMAFLCEENLSLARWMEEECLLTLNNANDYIGSGSMGYTRRLPAPGMRERVRMRDLWLLLESQETVGVGPDLFQEFIYPYQEKLAAQFGRVYYGCCEPLHNRWEVIKDLPNLARVSVSPWADQEAMAGAMGPDLVFSRKPNPTLISTDRFDEAAIRADLRRTLEVAGKRRLEIIMKDVHTLRDEPDRLPRWVRFAREEIARAG